MCGYSYACSINNTVGLFLGVYFPGSSHRISPEEFDRAMSINCRGTMISSREEISRMLRQDPLGTHDGREGNRGVIVNICSSGGIASRPSCRACFLSSPLSLSHSPFSH